MPGDHPPLVVVMGVEGAGKTTVGRRLADELGVEFIDGDDEHSAAAKERMAAGIPLDDAMHARPGSTGWMRSSASTSRAAWCSRAPP